MGSLMQGRTQARFLELVQAATCWKMYESNGLLLCVMCLLECKVVEYVNKAAE